MRRPLPSPGDLDHGSGNLRRRSALPSQVSLPGDAVARRRHQSSRAAIAPITCPGMTAVESHGAHPGAPQPFPRPVGRSGSPGARRCAIAALDRPRAGVRRHVPGQRHADRPVVLLGWVLAGLVAARRRRRLAPGRPAARRLAARSPLCCWPTTPAAGSPTAWACPCTSPSSQRPTGGSAGGVLPTVWLQQTLEADWWKALAALVYGSHFVVTPAAALRALGAEPAAVGALRPDGPRAVGRRPGHLRPLSGGAAVAGGQGRRHRAGPAAQRRRLGRPGPAARRCAAGRQPGAGQPGGGRALAAHGLRGAHLPGPAAGRHAGRGSGSRWWPTPS